MRFLEKELVWHILWIIPLLSAVALAEYIRRKSGMRRIFCLNKPTTSLSSPKRIARFFCFAACAVCLVLAIARPSWGYSENILAGNGRDIIILFDTSRSMLCSDVQPSRLEHSKWLIAEIVRKNPGSRFGIVAFAGTAFTVCPLTSDTPGILQCIDGLNTDTVAKGGTNLEAALEEAVKAFPAAESPNRAIILITDGDELYGKSQNALDKIKKAKIPLFVAGAGDPSQPSVIQIPDKNNGFVILKDKNGNAVNSPLNEKQMRKLAYETGGLYVRTTAVKSNINLILQRIQRLEYAPNGALRGHIPLEKFIYFLIPGIIFFLFYLICGERKKITILLFLIWFGHLSFGAGNESFENAVNEHKNGNLQKAAEIYSKFINIKDYKIPAVCNLAIIEHENTRKLIAGAENTLKAQKLDETAEQLKNTKNKLDEVELVYRETMRNSLYCKIAAENQAKLINDRKRIDELLKKIEDLKKLEEQARKQTEDLKQKQQKQNQNKNTSENEKKDLQKQTQNAAETAEQLKKAANDLKQENIEKKAQTAKNELNKALNEQKKNNGKNAEKHINNALKALEQGKQQGKQQNKQQDKQNPQQKKNEKQQGQNTKEKPKNDKNENINALLDMMTKDEKNIQERIRQQQQKNRALQPVEKDW